jgi:hypothetical protein
MSNAEEIDIDSSVQESAKHDVAKPVRVKLNKKAKLRALEQLRTAGTPNALMNVYGVQRKLLVFDINKVLLFRQARSSQYIVRPHAKDFIVSMAERYTLAVWTSMTKRLAQPILTELFEQTGVPLLFKWYQNRCRAVPSSDSPDDKPIFLKELHRVWAEHRQFHEGNTVSSCFHFVICP